MNKQNNPGGINFVTYVTENYSRWLELWLMSVCRSNPDSDVFVYDVSLPQSEAVRQLVEKYPQAVYVPWPESKWQWPAWVDKTTFEFFRPNHGFAEEMKFLAHRLRHLLTGFSKEEWILDKKGFMDQKRHVMRIWCQKPHIVLDALAKSSRPLAYVDVDAMVLDRFADYPCPDMDAAVTIIDQDQIRIGPDGVGPDGPLPVNLLNSGVVFLNNSPGAKLFLSAWASEIARVPHLSTDQTPLANLLQRLEPKFYEDMRSVSLAMAGERARIGCLPCHRYNQYRIPRNQTQADPAAAVIHFVGSWKKQECWPQILQLVESEWQRRGHKQ